MAKSQDNSPPNGETLRLQEVYANLYNEITQPDRVAVMTQYFRQNWVPRLGHSLAWLIIALRQHCYWNRKTGEVRSWCQVTQEELAAEIGVEPRTIRRLLQQPEVGRFIIEVKERYGYDRRLGKRVRETTTYQIRMDDPLTPEDEALLRQRLAENTAGLGVDAETGQQDMLRLLDRLSGNGHLPDILSTRSDDLPDILSGETGHLPDKMSTRSGDLPDILSTRSDHLPDILSGETGHLPDKMSALNNSTLNSSLLLTVPEHQHQHAPPNPVPEVGGGAVIGATDLPDFVLASDAVLVPLPPDARRSGADTDGDAPPGSYRVETLEAIVRRDLLHAKQVGSSTVQDQTEVFYSVADALGTGGDEWQPDEMARIELRKRLERDLGACLVRLGAFSLAEALQTYFSSDLSQRFLAGKSDAELRRIAGWLAYTRRAMSLKSPSGFLRSKLESREEPPLAAV